MNWRISYFEREKKSSNFFNEFDFELGKNPFRTLVAEHYSEIRGLGLMKCSSETRQNFVIFLEYKKAMYYLVWFDWFFI